MLAKDYRNRAWGKLSGKWGTFAIIMLIYFVIIGALEGFSGVQPQGASTYLLVSIFSVVSFILAGPFEYGLRSTALSVANSQPIKVENLFDGFKDFTRTFLLYLINSVFIFLWSLLLIVPGIIAAIRYSMSYHILQENPNMSANDARKESIRLMEGHKWQYFCLIFSFIGWILLSILTCGILLLWVQPYMYVASAEFYNELQGKSVEISDKKPEETTTDKTEEKPEEEQAEEK